MFRSLLTTILCLLAASLGLQAQDYTQTIRGTISDKESQLKLEGAVVVVLGTDPLKGGTTDRDGNFRIENVPLGRYNLRITYVGYKESYVNDLVLGSGKEAVLNIELSEAVVQSKQAVVKGGKPKGQPNNDMISVSGRSFTIEQTNRFAGSFGDPSRMAATFAGVSGATGQRNDIVIRGNSPMGLLWRVEGIDVPNPNHFASQGSTGGPVSILNNNTLANSDFITGAFPADYGNAVSGVFDLKVRNGNNEKREFTGQIGFNGVELMAEGPFSKKKGSSYLLSYRYSTLKFFSMLGISFGTAGIPYYQDLTLKLNFPTKKFGQFQVTGIGGLSNITLETGTDTTAQTYGLERSKVFNGSNLGVVILSHTKMMGKKGYLRTNLAGTYQLRFTRADSLDLNKNATFLYGERATNRKAVLHSFYQHKVNARNSFRGGVIVSWFFMNLADSFRNNLHEIVPIRNFDGNALLVQEYFQWKHHFGQRLSANAGLHYSWFSDNQHWALEPRVGLQYSFRKGNSLNFGYGLHSQLQPLEILFTETKLSNGSIVLTNRDLNFSRSHQWVLGYDLQLTENFRLKAETYYQWLYGIPVDGYKSSNFSLLNFGADFGTLPVADSLKNGGNGRNYGLELTLERFFSKNYYFLVTASLFESKFRGSDHIWRNTAYNGNYVVNALAGSEHKLSKKLSLTLNGRITAAGGRRYTPVDEQASVAAQDAVYDQNRLYDLQFRPYFRADLKVTVRMNSKRVTQEWGIDIQNISNQQNPLTQTWDSANQRVRTEYQIGIFPVGLYRIQF